MDVNSRDPSQNIIPFRIKGVDVARFDTFGNFGIGTNTPTAKLDVAGTVRISGDLIINGSSSSSFSSSSSSGVVINMDSQPLAPTALNRQKKQSIPLAVPSTLSTSDIVAKMSGVSVGKSQNYGVGAAQMTSYGNIVVAVGEGTNSIAYSLTNPPTASSWVGIPNGPNTFTVRGRSITYANGTWVAVGEGTNSIAYSTQTPPVASSWVGISDSITYNNVTTRNTFITCRDIAYGNGVWVTVGDGTNSIAYSLANPPTAETWIGITISSTTNFNQANSITFENGTWVATGQATNGIAYSTRSPPTSDSWIVVPLTNQNDASLNNTFSSLGLNIIYANGVWLAAGQGTNALCYSVENPPIAGSWFAITTSLFFSTGGRSIAYGNGIWVACGETGSLLAYSTSRIPHNSSWVAMKGPTVSSSAELIRNITFNAATNTWYFMGDISSNCMFYSTATPPVPATWVGIQRSTSTFTIEAYGSIGITTPTFTSPINVARLDNKVSFPANRMLSVGGGGSGADVLAQSSLTPAPAITGTISYSDDDGVTWAMVPGGATNAMFSSAADISANVSFGVGGSRGANAVAWNGEKWVTAGNGRTNSLAFSDDGGMTWTGITGKSIFSVEARDVTWNGQMWVAVGRGTIFSTAYSYDGITWMGAIDALGAPVNVFSYDIAGPTASTSDISGGGNHVIWNGKMWVATGTRTLIAGSSPPAYYTIAYSFDGKTWTGVPDSGMTSSGFDIYAHGIAWNGRNFIATGRGTANTLVNFTDVSGISAAAVTASWQGLGNTVFSVWGRGITWGARRWIATGRGTNTVAYSTNGRNWQGCGANVFKPLRRFMAMGDTGLYTTVSMGQPQRGVAFSYSDDGVTWDAPVVNQAVGFSTPTDTSIETARSAIFTNQMLLTNVITDNSSQHFALMYSTDAGASWARVPGSSDILNNGGTDMTVANLGSYSLAMNPSRTRFLVGGGDAGNATRKVYISNDGFNWRNPNSAPLLMAWVYAALWDGSNNRWLIGGNDSTTLSSGRIMYSGDADASSSWVSGALYPTSIITCLAANTDFSVLLAGSASGNTIYRSINGGQTWTTAHTGTLSISNLVASYNFDGNSNDSSPNNNNLTNINSVTYNTTNYKRGSAAAAFNGSNYFEVANDGRFSPDNFTVACWVRPVASSGTIQAIASCRNSGTVSGWRIFISAENDLTIQTELNQPRTLFVGFGLLNRWVHIAFTLNKSTSVLCVVYMNGVELTTTTSLNYVNNTGTNLRIGAGSNESAANFFMGNGSFIDDFRFYNKVLTPFEIGSIFEDGSIRSIAFSPLRNRWVAVGAGPISGYNIIYSTDASGSAWTSSPNQSVASSSAIFKNGSEASRVIWDAVSARFIVGGWNGQSVSTLTNVFGLDAINNNPGYTMAYSADGIDWTPVTVRADNATATTGASTSTFGPFLTRCREIMALDTAGDFTPVNTGYTVSWNSYANRFVATGNGTTPLVYSNDGGLTWIPANQQPPQQAIAVAGGVSAAAGTTTISPLTYTIDGKTWSQSIGAKEIFGTGAVNTVEYGQTSTAVSPNGRIWVAGGTTSGGAGTSCLAFSQNGIRWSAITSGTTLITNVRTIMYAPTEQLTLSTNASITAASGVGNGVWVAGGDGINSLIFSYDGISWSEVPNSLTILSRCNACAFANGIFIAGGVAPSSVTTAFDTSANMVYSTDGINWQPIRNSTSRISVGATIGSIAYGRDENGRGLWVAGALGSATISVLYSYNGIDWIGVVNSGTNISSIGVTSIAYGISTTTGRGLWLAAVQRNTNDGNAFVFSSTGRDGWTAVPNTKTGLFDLSGGGPTGISYLNGVWYATGSSVGVSTGRTLAYSYDGSGGWFGVYPSTNIYGTIMTTFSLTDMRCIATTNDYIVPAGASAGTSVSFGTASASFRPMSMTPVRGIGWTSGIGSAYLQHPTLLYGADNGRVGTTAGAISADGGRRWESTNISVAKSAFCGGICNDTFWNGTTWVAVGNDPVTGAKVATSKDGVAWTQIPGASIPINGALNTITWDGKIWMVGGDGSPITDTNTASIAWSSDLMKWNGILNTDISLTVVKRIAWNGMYWVAVGKGVNTTMLYSKRNGLVWEDTFTVVSGSNKTSTITTIVNDVVWGGGRWVAVGRGNSISDGSGVSILYSVDTPESGGIPADYAITGRRWRGVPSSAQLFPYGANSVSWNGKRFIATGPAFSSCSTSNIIAWSADGISWNGYSTTKTLTPGQRWIAVGSGSRACIALSADGRVWTDVSGSSAFFSDISGATSALANTMKTGARTIGWNGSSLIVGGARSATTTTAASQQRAISSIGRTTIPVCAFIGSGNGVLGGGTTNVPDASFQQLYMRTSSSVFITHMDVNIREPSAPWANMWLNTYTDLSATQLFQVTPDSQMFSSALKWNGWSWVANFGLTTNDPLTGDPYGSIWYCTDPLARVGWSVASNYVNPRILMGQGGYAALEWNGVAWLACGYDPNNNNMIYTTDKYGAIGWTAVSGIVTTGSASFQPVCIASSPRFWVVGGAQGTTSALYYTNDRTGATGWRAITGSVLPGIRITSIGYNGFAWICCGGGGAGTGAPASSNSSISWRTDTSTNDIGTGWTAATISGTNGGFPPVLTTSSAVVYNTGAQSPLWVVVGDVSFNSSNQVAYTTDISGSREWKIATGTFTNTLFGRLNGLAWTGYSWIATSGAGSSRIMSTMDITAATSWNSSPTNSIFTPTVSTNAVTYVNMPISLLTTGMPTSIGAGAGTGAMWRGGIGRAQGLLQNGGTETTSVIVRSVNGAEATRWSPVYSRNFLIAVGGGIIRDASNNGGTNRMAYSYDGGLSWTTNNTTVMTNAASNVIGSIRTVKYGNGMWVAGGDISGSSVNSNNCLAWSRDGVNWFGAGGTHIFGSAGACYAVCCSDRGRWVAVGGSPLTTSEIYTNTSGSIYTMAWSDDGMNWTPILSSRALFGIVCQGVSYGADASGVGMWTAIGRGTSYTGVAYSYDAKNWFLSQTSVSLFGTSVNVLTERYAPWSGADWRTVAMNSTGQYQFAAINAGLVYRSVDYGVTWTALTLPVRAWVSVAVSSTGKYVMAASSDGTTDRLYNSTDYGITWVARGFENTWKQVAISASGQHQVGVISGNSSFGIQVSSNYGVTWRTITGQTEWTCIAISSSGQYITAAGFNTAQVHISSDYGVNWAQRTTSQGNWASIAMSSTGQIQIGSQSLNTNIQVSTDYGFTWGTLTNSPAGTRYRSLAISSTGFSYIVGVRELASDTIKRQTVIAGTFTNHGPSTNYFAIAISATGQYQTAVSQTSNGVILISSNFGETWSAAANDSRSLGITYGKDANGAGMWVATAGRRDRSIATTAANTMAYSYDGKLWRGITASAGLSEQAWSVAYGKDGFGVGMWVAAGYDVTCGLKWSYDGITWNATTGASGAAVWTGMAAGRRALCVYWNGSMWLASTSDTRNGEPRGTGIAANNASGVTGYLLYSYNGKNWLPALAPNTYDATISATTQPSLYSVLPNPTILDFGSLYDDPTQRGGTISNTKTMTVGAVMSGGVPIKNVHTIVPYGKGSLTTGQVPFLLGGDSGLVDLTPFEPLQLYAFTSHTFTNAGQTGREGPELATVRNAYTATGATWATTYLKMTTRGIQEWTVPETGNYTIRAVGAAGSGSNGTPGRGRDIHLTTTLTKGEVIMILVGQRPDTLGFTGQGGGGTFVVRGSITNPIPLVVAGGGGGTSSPNGNNMDATSTTSGRDGGSGVQVIYGNEIGAGGTNGNGGGGGAGSGGGGLYTSGGAGWTGADTNGKSFISGGLGGSPGQQYGGGFNGGGFGGGAGGQSTVNNPGAGGGGGYSGGGAGGGGFNSTRSAGGGGSYGITTLTDNGATNTGHGSVTITLVALTLPTIPTRPITSELAAATTSLSTSTDGGITWRAVPNSTRVMTKVNKILCDETTQQIVAVGTGNYSVATSTPAKAADADGWVGVFGSRMMDTRAGLFEKYGTGASWFGGAKMWIASGRVKSRRGSSLAVSVNGMVWHDAKIVTETTAGVAAAARGGGLMRRTTTSLTTPMIGLNNQDGFVSQGQTSSETKTIVNTGNNPNILYEFVSHTFTNAGATGRFGPNLEQVKTAYTTSVQWSQNSNFLDMLNNNGIQRWKVPATGSYTIRARGARGGTQNGGYGRDIQLSTTLNKDEVILILVGQRGSEAGNVGGGGGGTFVMRPEGGSSYISILIAGGGGGGQGAGGMHPTSTGLGSAGAPGVSSGGGMGGDSLTGGGEGYNYAGGGGGVYSNGLPSATGGGSFSGLVWNSGGNGGQGRFETAAGPDGGFGGGGGASYLGASGGGGGASGGGGGGYSGGAPRGGGGGGSYSSLGVGQITDFSEWSGDHGQVIITANFTISATITTITTTIIPPTTVNIYPSYPISTPGGIPPSLSYHSVTTSIVPYTQATTPLITYTDSAAAFSTQVGSVAVNSQYNRAVVGGSSVQFVAGGRAGSSNGSGLVYSNDGINWTAIAAGTEPNAVFQTPTNITRRTGSGGFDASFGTVSLTQRFTIPATYPSGSFQSICMNKTGQYQSAVNQSQLLISSDYGVNWTVRESTRLWYCIGMSSSGQYQTAGVNTEFLYTSIDYGFTWSARPTAGSRGWYYVTISSSGQYQTAADNGGFLYTSNNYGENWRQVGPGSGEIRAWRGLSMSGTGQFQIAVATGGNLYYSSDYGISWNKVVKPSSFTTSTFNGAAISSSAQYQSVVINTSVIWTSSDYGITFVTRDTTRNWSSISMSSTGQYQSATVSSGFIYISSDYGVSWTARMTDANRSWTSISLNNTGQYQSAVVTSGTNQNSIYTSSNYGVTWVQRLTSTKTNAFTRIRSSASGQYQIATSGPSGITNGQLYISSDYGQTWCPRRELGTWSGGAVSGSGAIMMSSYPYSLTSTAPIFNGTADNVNLGYKQAFNIRSNFTVECWFRTTDTTLKLTATLVSRNSTGGTSSLSQFSLYLNSSGQVGFSLTNNTGSFMNDITALTYRDSLWHHVAGTYNSTTGTKIIYIDGVMSRTDTNASFGLLSDNTTINLVIGSDHFGIAGGTDRQFRGSISDVRLWNVTRSATDIANNYRTRLFGSENGLAGYWKLDQSTGLGLPSSLTGFKDSTSNGNNSTGISFSSLTWNTNTSLLNNIFISSTDYGNTFNDLNSVYGGEIRSISITNNAKIQTAIANGGNIFRSLEYGTIWDNSGITIDGNASTNVTTPRNWQDVVISAETGIVQVACVNNGLLYVSTNTGSTWISSSITINLETSQSTNRSWQAVAVSANGQFGLACVNSTTTSGFLYRSTNSCASWTSTDISINGLTQTNRAWQDVAMSANGKYQVACVGTSGNIFYSKNYGVSWTTLQDPSGTRAWSSISLSENGSTISATTNDASGAIFTYSMPDDQYYLPAVLDNSGGSTTPSTVRTVAYGNSGTGASTDGYWVAGSDASGNSLAYSSNGIDWTGVVGSKTTLFNAVNSVAYGTDMFGQPMWVAVGVPFVGSIPGSTAFSIAYSYNMTTWTGVRNISNFTGQGNHVAYGQDEFGEGIWVAVGQGDGLLSANLGESAFFNSNGTANTTIFYSYDGANWAAAQGDGVFSTSGTDVAWGVDASGVPTWVATGIAYTDPLTGVLIQGGQVAHSLNGRVWSPIRTLTSIDLSANTLPATSRGSVMLAPPTSTGMLVPTYNNIWRMLGNDIDGEAMNDESGRSVSISADGTVVAIGAINNDGSANLLSNSGHVRVYKYNPFKTIAQLNQNLPGFGPIGWDRLGGDIDGEGSPDQSGFSISLSANGTIIAIGANLNDGSGNIVDSGHVRVYKYRAEKTEPQLTNFSPNAVNFGPAGWDRLGADIDGEANPDQSGYSVSLSADGTVVAIGAINNDGSGNLLSNSGHVRVYKYNPLKSTAQLIDSGPGRTDFGPVGWDRLGADIDGEAVNDQSGFSVSISADGTTVAIGANQNDGTSGNTDNNRGHVRVYKFAPNKTVAQMNPSLANFGPIRWNRLGDDIDGDEYLYENYGPFAIPTLNITTFPVVNSITNWEIDISFTVISGQGNYRALVGSMYNATDTNRGWGVWVSNQNGIHFSTSTTTYESHIGGVSLNVPYITNITKIGTTIHVRLINLSTQTSVTTTHTISGSFGTGPVSIGGWANSSSENFTSSIGTISYVKVLSYFQSQSGCSVCMSADGTTVAIGALGNDATGTDAGHVRVYKYSDIKLTQNGLGPAGWNRLGADIDGETAGDESGFSVSLSADGTIVAIGGYKNDSISGSAADNRGHVRVYKYNQNKRVSNTTNPTLPTFGPVGWDRIGVDIDGETASDQSGFSVSLSADGTTIAIGANQNDGAGNNSGHLRVYKVDTFSQITYTSSNPAIAEIYGNALLLIKEGASGTTTITATQAATPPFTLLPITVQGTLTVSGTTYTLQYTNIVTRFTPFSTSALTVAYGRTGERGAGAPIWIIGGSGTNVFARSSHPSAITSGTWTVIASNDPGPFAGIIYAPFPICNSISYSNGVWLAGNNTDHSTVFARSIDGGISWTPVYLSSVSGIIAGVASIGVNSFCNYSLACADYSNDTNLRSWVAVQGTKNFMFDGGVNTVATVTPNINATSYNATSRAWWVAGGKNQFIRNPQEILFNTPGNASIAYTLQPLAITGWTLGTSTSLNGGNGIIDLEQINDIAFSPHTEGWLAVGVGTTSFPTRTALYSTNGSSWTSAVVSSTDTSLNLNTCIWNQLDVSASSSGRWLAGGTRSGSGSSAISLYISTDTNGQNWTPITGTGAILSQVYSLAYNGRVWIAGGVPATDNGSTSSMMRTTDPTGATGWVGIAGTNSSTGGFDTSTRSITWNAEHQMWLATGENTIILADGLFSSIVYSLDISGSTGTWRSVRETNSFCFSNEGTGITFKGDKWFATGKGINRKMVATTGASSDNASTSTWTSIAHGAVLDQISDITYTGRRFIATGSGTGTSNGVIITTDNSGSTWSAAAATPGPAFNDTFGGGTSVTFEPSYEGTGRIVATGRSATNSLSVSTDGGVTWEAPTVQFSTLDASFVSTTQPLFTTGGNSVAYIGNDTLFAGGGNDVQWTGKRWVAVGRNSSTSVVAELSSASILSADVTNNNTSVVATSDDGITWNSVIASQAPNLSEGTVIASNSRIGATPLINSQIIISDSGDTETNVDYGGTISGIGGSGTGVAQIDIIAELTPVSNAASSVVSGAVNILGTAGNGGTISIGNAPPPSFDNTAFTITTRPI